MAYCDSVAKMKGITTILDHKKWTFLFTVLIMSFCAMMLGKLEGVYFAGIISSLGTIVVAMSAAEKSKWRKEDG